MTPMKQIMTIQKFQEWTICIKPMVLVATTMSTSLAIQAGADNTELGSDNSTQSAANNRMDGNTTGVDGGNTGVGSETTEVGNLQIIIIH